MKDEKLEVPSANVVSQLLIESAYVYGNPESIRKIEALGEHNRKLYAPTLPPKS